MPRRRDQRRRAPDGVREADARPGRGDRRSSVVGPGRARVELTADFDFNRVTQTSDKYDPDSRVVRSSQTREESSATNDGHENQVTVGNEVPSGNQRQPPTAAPTMPRRRAIRAGSPRKSSITRSPRPPRPRSSRAAASTASRSRYWSTAPTAKNDKGESTYQPRSKEEIEQIAALVRTAIGFDAEARRSGRRSSICASPRRRRSRSASRRRGSRCCNSPRTTSCGRSRWG